MNLWLKDTNSTHTLYSNIRNGRTFYIYILACMDKLIVKILTSCLSTGRNSVVVVAMLDITSVTEATK